jgi:hypothetical protein
MTKSFRLLRPRHHLIHCLNLTLAITADCIFGAISFPYLVACTSHELIDFGLHRAYAD